MTNKEQIREVVALILILMIIVIPTVVVFFLTAGRFAESPKDQDRSEKTGLFRLMG